MEETEPLPHFNTNVGFLLGDGCRSSLIQGLLELRFRL